MNGTTFHVYSTSAFAALKAALKRCRKGRKKVIVRNGCRPIETSEKFGIENPCRDLNSAFFDGCRSESHELGLIASTVKPEVLRQTSESNEGDNMWNSPEWQTDARSTASTEGNRCMGLEPSAEF